MKNEKETHQNIKKNKQTMNRDYNIIIMIIISIINYGRYYIY